LKFEIKDILKGSPLGLGPLLGRPFTNHTDFLQSMRIGKKRLLFLRLVKGGEILDGNIPVLKRKNIKKRITSIFELKIPSILSKPQK
jgi:hypothetical protein